MPVAETLLPIDAMYNTIYKTLSSLQTTTADGMGPDSDDPQLQAYANKQLLPDTELEMMHSQAVPMSDVDIKAMKATKERRSSLQYRQAQLKIPAMTLEELTGSRVRIAYRLTRYMTHIRGVGGAGQPLVHSMGVSNAQVNLFDIPLPYNPTVGIYRGLAAVRNLLAQAEESGYKYSYLLNGEQYIAHGMSILPPPLHDGYFPDDKPKWEYRRTQYLPERYEGCKDYPLAIYLNICELLVRQLGIGEEDIEEQAAVLALLNPKVARRAWPCRDDIETFEEFVLLPYVGRLVVANSQDEAITILKKDMGLTHLEAFDLVETYKTYALQVNTFDPTRERSLLLSQLQKLAQECGDAGMVTTQLNTYKTTLQTLGLTRHEEDSNVDKRASLGSALEAEIIENTVKQLPVVEEGSEDQT